MNYKELKYTVENQRGISHDDAMRVWKTTYASFEDFKKRVITHDTMKEFGDYCQSIWNDIVPVTVTEAFAEPNLELRRLYFKAIGIEKMFKELEPTLINREVLQFSNITYDEKNQPSISLINDIYELYLISGDKLFPEEKSDWRRANADIYAVRCWCTTTGREYWIYVPRWVGEKKDAIEAIAWTFQLNITDPEYIVRQGDIIIAKASDKSREVRHYYLDRKNYLKYLKCQS